MKAASTFLALAGVGSAGAFIVGGAASIARPARVVPRTAATSPLMAVPLELEGKLDESKTWEVELELDGVTKTVTVQEGTSVLYAAKSVFDDPPCSCQQGICTTCAGFIREGTRDDNYKVAVDALGEDQREKGYTLTCQTFPCGPGLKILLNQYDTVYEMQYGQYEVKADEPKKKMFGIF